LVIGALLASGLLLGERRGTADEFDSPDVQLFRQTGIARDRAGLVAFLRERCGNDADLRRVAPLIRQLGSSDFDEREEASKALTALGPAAAARLREAVNDSDTEVARRARDCVKKIDAGPDPDAAPAAVRLLIRKGPKEAVPTLLRFLPYAGGEELQEEVWFGLDALVVREGRLDPALTDALTDALPARRAAAACIVGRRGDAEQRAAVRKLLKDSDAEVRLRAAQGLLACGDGAGLPALVALLEDTPLETAWQAEELLRYVAGDDSPRAVVGTGTAAERREYRKAWEAWREGRGAKVDLAKLDGQGRRPGLTLLCDGGTADADNGRVWLLGCDGTTRWELRKLSGPANARLVSGPRVLIAERAGAAERSPDGKLVWRFEGLKDPRERRRLPDGRIFVAGRGLATAQLNAKGEEVKILEKKEVEGLPGCVCPHRLSEHRYLCRVEKDGTVEAIVEYDPTDGSVLHKMVCSLR
jgi:hypothetical protein